MAKVKIQGNASGTGVVTLTAPNTNSDRTITLPDGTGELLAKDSSGNVGIGTSSPNRKLKVHSSSTAPIIDIEGSKGSGYELGFGVDGSGGFIQQNGATNLRMWVSGSERMRIDSAGRVTMPYQPAFRVGTAGGYTCTSDYDPINFGNIHLNVGNNYNSSTHTFTAPVTGVYSFSFSGNAINVQPHWASFLLNGSRGSSPILYDNSGATSGWVLISGSWTTKLLAGDYVQVGGVLNSRWDSSNWTSFSGHLIG